MNSKKKLTKFALTIILFIFPRRVHILSSINIQSSRPAEVTVSQGCPAYSKHLTSKLAISFVLTVSSAPGEIQRDTGSDPSHGISVIISVQSRLLSRGGKIVQSK